MFFTFQIFSEFCNYCLVAAWRNELTTMNLSMIVYALLNMGFDVICELVGFIHFVIYWIQFQGHKLMMSMHMLPRRILKFCWPRLVIQVLLSNNL